MIFQNLDIIWAKAIPKLF